MARYRSKDEVDLAWNAVRRAATARVRLEVRTYEERRLNEVLTQLWSEFQSHLARGEVMELEPDYEKWVSDALDHTLIEGGRPE